MPRTLQRIVAGIVAYLAVVILQQSVGLAGTITGHGRFEKIAGNPSAGYKELYEWDLYLSPSNNSMVGPSRRLGAPPGQQPTGDGYYRIDNVPSGRYSVYVNQPDFFASPQVVTDVQIGSGTTNLNVDLDVDYSTYFKDGNQWTDWQWDWYQTYTAQGTSVRGVSWMMAGWGQYRDKTAQVRILEDNGNPNPKYWTQVGYGTDGSLASDSDEWVRWTSGEVPMTPGKQYAVNIHIDGGMAVYRRNKDGQSYQGGRAYDQNGNPQNFDLNCTVFTDRDEIVSHTSKSSGAGNFDGNFNGNRFGQSFVATGQALAAVDLFAASGQSDIELTWKVRRGGPTGPQVGPTKRTRGSYFASSTDLIGVSYNKDEIPLTPGETYYIDVYNSGGITPYLQQSWERYNDGRAYRNGVATNEDLSMTIVEHLIETAEVIGRHIFYNYSRFDNQAAGRSDDLAIAPDKTALMPGETATFENYTSYSRGINGIMVDIDGLAGDPTIDDFQFKVGNDDAPGAWSDAPEPLGILVRDGAGVEGADRIAIYWANGAIADEWLQVTVLATDATGLEEDDVFYFGNAIGEAGNSPAEARVNAVDALLARNNPRTFRNPAPIDFDYDYDRDGRVNATDMLSARNAQAHLVDALRLITVPGKGGGSAKIRAALVPEPSGLAMLAAGLAGLLACSWLWRPR